MLTSTKLTDLKIITSLHKEWNTNRQNNSACCGRLNKCTTFPAKSAGRLGNLEHEFHCKIWPQNKGFTTHNISIYQYLYQNKYIP